MVFGPFHYCASCERAAPDAPETIDDRRRCTGCRYRTIHGGSRGSASVPAPAKWLFAWCDDKLDSRLLQRLSQFTRRLFVGNKCVNPFERGNLRESAVSQFRGVG